NNVVQKKATNLRLKEGDNTINQAFKSISNPHLWSPGDPYLYRVVSQIFDRRSGKVLDEISNPLGLRWFKFDADNGFFLNGKHMKLIGANRHQDYPGMGNAVPEHLQIRDIELLKKMGANFIRISHYPQDPVILQECDKLGILASVEIPIVNTITESDAFTNNCEHMMTEMIRQNFNHPSVIIWAYMNEVLLVPRFRHDPARQKIYFKHVYDLAEKLETLARKEDPFRYTMIPFHDYFDIYYKTGLTSVPMIDGWNQYEGWYGHDITGVQRFLDRAHKLIPDKPIFVTEYGAGADPRLHSFHPERFDFTVEYQTYFHKYFLNSIMKRPFVAGSSLWNLSDFGSEGRGDAVPHINNKGMLGYNRVPKATYYFYQSRLLKKPFVKIASRQWTLRGGIAKSDQDLFCTQPVQVFTNEQNVDLTINGKNLGNQSAENGIATFNVPFSNGVNKIVATSKVNGLTFSDNATIKFHLEPANLDSKALPFQNINISLGTLRYFSDKQQHQIWLPDQEYQNKTWGSEGGETYVMPGRHNEPYGTDKNILGTDEDPIYQTQKVDIKDYKLDVPDGSYTVKLYFSEINNDSTRTFDVVVNGTPVVQNLNLYKEYGPYQAVSFKTYVIT
ncbi:MAG: glycoside hydrolase family 2 TIM barrel-domain containing protein, partial [Gammaproteobacteria bacterium]